MQEKETQVSCWFTLIEINLSISLVLVSLASSVCVVVGARGWLHMEVMEKDKMQWMTDVSLHPQPEEVGEWDSQ